MRVADIEANIYTADFFLSPEMVKKIKNYQKYIFKKNSFVISCDGTIDKIGWLKRDCCSSVSVINIDTGNYILNKYLYYYFLTLKKNKYFDKLARGSVINHLYVNQIENIKVFLPSDKEQKRIIDIIEQKEKFFLKYFQCIRIGNFQNTKKDTKKLIDIIEPLEILLKQINYLRQNICMWLKINYEKAKNKLIPLNEFIRSNYMPYQKQKYYLSTSAIRELTIDFNKIVNITPKTKLSWVDLTPKVNSILFSKLVGENKVLPISDWELEFVFSSGMYCVRSKNNDHLLSFLLSSSFTKQKFRKKTGTTLMRINDKVLKQIKIKDTNKNVEDNVFTNYFSFLNFLEWKIQKIIKKIIYLLIN